MIAKQPYDIPKSERVPGVCSQCGREAELVAASDFTDPGGTGWCRLCTIERAQAVLESWLSGRVK